MRFRADAVEPRGVPQPSPAVRERCAGTGNRLRYASPMAVSLPALSDIDLSDKDVYQRGVPHEWFTRLPP